LQIPRHTDENIGRCESTLTDELPMAGHLNLALPKQNDGRPIFETSQT
jgi:hypothetical protein